jgi:hypothetical protein
MRPHLQDLVDQTAWRKIEALVGDLPPFGCGGAFEVHLGAGMRRVDIGLSSNGPRGKQMLARALAREGSLPAVAAVAPVLAEWTQPGTSLCEKIHVIWLEYDLAEETVSPPMIHLGLCDANAKHVRELIDRNRRIVSGRSPDEKQLAALELCFDALPRSGAVSFVADQHPSRPTRDLRVVADLPREEILPWLRAMAWPGECERCELILALFAEGCPYPSVFLDVGEQVEPGLGMEIHLPDLHESPQSWETFMRGLVEIGAATPEQVAAVPRWAGSMTVEVPGMESLIRVDRCPGFKIVLDAAGRLTAKVYLGFHTRSALF